ncbi:MAG: AbrB family transcriptional regulator [Silicimonas sp.]|uniref:AbrB family transcriptional regulator n=1 Tax=Roseovarius sp. TaxID=1486281 RepID=UPI0032EC739B
MPHILTTLALLALSGLAGFAAQAIGTPLPFMLGPLACSALIATALPRHLPQGYRFPTWLRLVFIAIIGLMIGSQVTPALFTEAHHYALTLGAVTLFVGLAHGLGYAVFRTLGGYDSTTAFYASTPGGLYESIEMGEAAGADMTRLMMQQFLRIIVVVTLLPLGLSLWLGAPVGSAAGQSLARGDVPWSDLPLVALAGLAGLALGHALRLPAGQMTGPMAVAALLSLTGWLSFDIPQWLVNLAQMVLGTALGMRFTGLSRGLLLRGAGLALVSVGGMLAIGVGLAALLQRMTNEPVDVLVISLAPGGVTEMALVALSLQANPAFVTLHHIYRILLTVVALGVITRLRQRTE